MTKEKKHIKVHIKISHNLLSLKKKRIDKIRITRSFFDCKLR